MKKTLAIALLLFLAANASAQAFYEASFEETGYGDFVVEGANKRECTEIVFTLQYPDSNKNQYHPIMSLNITFLPLTKGDAKVEVKIDDLNITSFGSSDAICSGNNCWKRIFLKQGIGSEPGIAEICLNTSNSITGISLNKNSFFGLYKSPRIEIETIPEKTTLSLGETLKVRLVARNTGSESATVEMARAREIAADKNAFRVVDGNTSWTGTINPGEEQEISYTVKPKVLGNISLTPALAVFENIFMEQETVFARPARILVNQPEKAVDVSIIKKNAREKVNENSVITVVVKNNTELELENVVVALLSDLQVIGGNEKKVSLSPRETENVEFTVTALSPGSYSVGCEVKYRDANTGIACEEHSIVFSEQEIPIWVLLGLVFAIIGSGVYAFIRYSK